MDISDIKALKIKMERQIFQILSEFETETSLKIRNVSVIKMELRNDEYIISRIEIKLESL